MTLDITTANVLRRQLISLQSAERREAKETAYAVAAAARGKARLSATRAELRSITASLRAAGYPVRKGDELYLPYA
jgi:hypothetical protein